jgi:hypothetical protein
MSNLLVNKALLRPIEPGLPLTSAADIGWEPFVVASKLYGWVTRGSGPLHLD